MNDTVVARELAVAVVVVAAVAVVEKHCLAYENGSDQCCFRCSRLVWTVFVRDDGRIVTIENSMRLRLMNAVSSCDYGHARFAAPFRCCRPAHRRTKVDAE